jgi:phosphate transport system protein
MKKFDHELDALHERVEAMGDTAQSIVSLAISAMTNLKPVYKKVLETEDKLDRMQLDIDHEAVRLLTVYSPVAADLRFLLAVIQVNMALERVGDQAVGVCHALDTAGRQVDGAMLPKLQDMGGLVQGMLRDAMQAFANRDAALARTTMAHDDPVDSLNDKILKEILSDDAVLQAIAPPRDLAGALTQVLLARSLERMADQATNICESVIYMVKGDDVRHQHGTGGGRGSGTGTAA